MGGKPANRPFDVLLKIDQRGTDECWPWVGKYKDVHGYGRFDVAGKAYRAHRVVYYYFFGGIELAGPKDEMSDQFVLHKCDNTSCCNPAHLYLGTKLQNMKDRQERGKGYGYEHSTKSPRAKLTTEEVLDIRAKKKAGATCKALALLYEVSPSTIHGVLYGRHYQDV